MPPKQDDYHDNYDDAEDTGRPGLPVDPGRLWLSLKRDWRWIPLAGAIWFGLALIVAFVFIKHSFKSEAVLVWEPGDRAEQRQLATEAGTMKLPGTMRRVIDELNLPISPRVLANQVQVYFDARSNLVTVQAAGPTAQDATHLTDGVVRVFLEQQRDMARARAQDLAKALEHDVAQARKRAAEAQRVYDAFRTEHGVSDVENEKQLAVAEVARLKQEQQLARAEFSSLDARRRELESLSKKEDRMVQTGTSANTDAMQLSQLRTELATARARYSADHPRLRMLEAQVKALEANLKENPSVASNVTTALNPEYQTLQSALSSTRAEQEGAEKRDEAYDNFIAAAEQRVDALSALEGEARSLKSDVQLAETRVADLEAQLAQIGDAVRSPQVEWRLLTPAVEPDWPERIKRRLVLAGMPVAGMAFAFLLLLVRPVLDGRIYTAREAGYWANLPVIGSSAWPRSRDMFFTLIDELGDQGVAAGGYTLVLGATSREKPLAEELAYWLGGGARSAEAGVGTTTRVEGPITPPPPPSAEHIDERTTAAEAVLSEPVSRSEALVPIATAGSRLSRIPNGTHAWLGPSEGPALRRAARMADRVIVLVSSGYEAFTDLMSLRTKLGREHGVGLVLLGVSPELLKLPDRTGDVEEFWRAASMHSRPV